MLACAGTGVSAITPNSQFRRNLIRIAPAGQSSFRQHTRARTSSSMFCRARSNWKPTRARKCCAGITPAFQRDGNAHRLNRRQGRSSPSSRPPQEPGDIRIRPARPLGATEPDGHAQGRNVVGPGQGDQTDADLSRWRPARKLRRNPRPVRLDFDANVTRRIAGFATPASWKRQVEDMIEFRVLTRWRTRRKTLFPSGGQRRRGLTGASLRAARFR